MTVFDAELHGGPAGTTPTGGEIAGGRLRRAAPLVGLTARTAGEAVVVGLRRKLAGTDSTGFHIRTAERYAELLGHSKGALMKAGQLFSFTAAGWTVPEELRSIYQEAFGRLRSEAPPMAPELARMMLQHELGSRATSAFAEFDPEPFAAASIGQVHEARLTDGREVAVKIQYPGVAEAIRADLKNAELLATFFALAISGLSPHRLRLDLRSAAREISARIVEELDYRLEASNQAAFAECYRGHPFIHVPDVVGGLCTRRVLTQELVRGRLWSDAVTAEQDLRNQWAEAIHRFGYGSYHRMNMFNTDPHPGNYLFHDDGSVSFLDFGSVKRIRHEQVEMLMTIYRACLRNDVLGTWRASVEAGIWRSTDPVTPQEVYDYWREDNELVWAEEQFIPTLSYVGKGVRRRYSPLGPSANAVRHANLPGEYTFIARGELGVTCVMAGLRASIDWISLVTEHVGGAPLTAMGKREHAFFAERRAAGDLRGSSAG
ncbi:MAG: AarF/ABC1/UbiB kinase family protein [Solirubrobacterales bacterium]|nr:AarF/ABC1/UbiB kinase family protein [Solirubrobacterales bacterium]